MFRIFTFIITTCMTLILIWAGGWLWFATTVALATPEESKEKTDAIIVLTGGNGRINAGLDLLSMKKADKLFISGVNEDVSSDDIYASWHDPSAARPCCLALGYKARDTLGNADEVKEWVDKNNISSFRLVTSSYHMPRASMLIERALPGKKIINHPVFSNDFEPWKGRFWELTFTEYNKSLISWANLDSQS